MSSRAESSSKRLRRLRHLLKTGADPAEKGDDGLPNREMVEARLHTSVSLAAGNATRAVVFKSEQIEAVLDAVYAKHPPDPYAFTGYAPEAIVIEDGSRPVFPIEGDRLQEGPGNGPFVDLLRQRQSEIEHVAKSVGRIESDVATPYPWSDKWYAGTAFLVAPKIAMTNRHVMQLMIRGSGAGTIFRLNGPYLLNFDAQYGSTGARRFKIERVLHARSDLIHSTSLDFSKLDMALLELGEPEDSSVALPDPLALSLAPPATRQRVAVIGYAGRPGKGAEAEAVLRAIFGERFGYKRCGSGEVDELPGDLPGDDESWVLQHDVSTLGGNSGSPVVDLSDPAKSAAVLALHFGGEPRVGNYAHVLDQLGDELKQHGVVILAE